MKTRGRTDCTAMSSMLEKCLRSQDRKDSLPPLPELVERIQTSLGGGPVARGLAFYEIGRLLIEPVPQDPASDVLREYRKLDTYKALSYLGARWDRHVLEKELAKRMSNGKLPSINYFAVLSWYFGVHRERQPFLKEMRAKSLTLKDFWHMTTTEMKNRSPGTPVPMMACFQLDDEPEGLAPAARYISRTSRPRHYSERQLAKVGVEVVDFNRVLLKCQSCGQVWSPMIQRGGKFPRGYWQCPNGCNRS